MPLDTSRFETQRRSAWPWRAGLVVSDPGLSVETASALADARATCVFQMRASASVDEIASAVERDRPDLLFVEFSAVELPARQWMDQVRGSFSTPLVAAVHVEADPARMIEALRAGATEFLSLPLQPAVFGALDRIAARLESTRTSRAFQNGRILGLLSAKGGCGATVVGCHLAAAMTRAEPSRRVLIADFDYQAPGVARVCGQTPKRGAAEAFESVRQLNSANWRDYFPTVTGGLDFLGGASFGSSFPPEIWRIESLFRHLTRTYSFVLADLGRHLNPGAWSFVQQTDELVLISAPDVLALYQTRYILQTLTARGFDRDRIRLVLNQSDPNPRDFWMESIEQMFEMKVYGVIPLDRQGLASGGRDKLMPPPDSAFSRAVTKLAARLATSESPSSAKKAA